MGIQSWFRGRALWRSVGLVGIVAAGFLAYGGVQHLGAAGTAKPEPAAALVQAAPATTSYADAVERAAPAVVTIRVEKRTQADQDGADGGQFFQRFFGPEFGGQTPGPQTQIERGLGSGVIVSPDGRILTNNHVVDGADRVAVTLADGREFTAKVLGTDAASDLAVVKIEATDLPALPLGNSDAVRVGDVVLAIGDPLNVGQTVTMGIISAKDRRTNDSGDNTSYEDFLQTDAPINRGNSGGALITARGELVGINSQILSDGMNSGNIGIGFAIPSNMARNVMNQLVATGHVRRAILGVTVQSMSSDLAKSLNLSTTHGAIVNAVEPGSAAEKAGVKQGDVILKVNGQPVSDSNELRNHVSSMTPGSSATLDINRDGADRQISVTLGEPAATKQASADHPSSPSDLGMTLEPLTPSLAGQFQVPRDVQGVAVTNVDDSSAAARAGLQPGDVIRVVNGKPVRSAEDVRAAVAARPDRPSLLYVQHGDTAAYIALGHN